MCITGDGGVSVALGHRILKLKTFKIHLGHGIYDGDEILRGS